jgi:hypothetical protein
VTTETVLHEPHIIEIARSLNWQIQYREVEENSIELARAIEQAVLQSPEIQALRTNAERCAKYQRLLEGAAAVLANAAETMEGGGRDECLAHEARSMAQTILFALPGDAAMEQKP